MNAYRQLETRFRRIGAIEQAISMLHWDAAPMTLRNWPTKSSKNLEAGLIPLTRR